MNPLPGTSFPAVSTRQGLLWCLGSVLLATAAQLALKYAMARLPSLSPLPCGALPLLAEARWRLPLAMLAFGLGCYFVSMLCWFAALRRLPLNYAYPMLSLSYVLVAVLAAVLPWFGETVTLLKTGGLLFIVFGIWLITTGRRG